MLEPCAVLQARALDDYFPSQHHSGADWMRALIQASKTESSPVRSPKSRLTAVAVSRRQDCNLRRARGEASTRTHWQTSNKSNWLQIL